MGCFANPFSKHSLSLELSLSADVRSADDVTISEGHDRGAVGGDGGGRDGSSVRSSTEGGVASTILDSDTELLTAIHNAVHRAIEAHQARVAVERDSSTEGGGGGGRPVDVQRFRRETETAIANMERAQVCKLSCTHIVLLACV